MIANIEDVLGAPLRTPIKMEFQDSTGRKETFSVVFVLSHFQLDTKGLRELVGRYKKCFKSESLKTNQRYRSLTLYISSFSPSC